MTLTPSDYERIAGEAVFDAVFNHQVSRNHNMTGRECRELAKAAIAAMNKQE